MLGFILGSDIVSPTCGEHEEHFAELILREGFMSGRQRSSYQGCFSSKV